MINQEDCVYRLFSPIPTNAALRVIWHLLLTYTGGLAMLLKAFRNAVIICSSFD